MAKKYAIIFPTKTFYTTSLRISRLQEVIILKNDKPKVILLDESKKFGRIYWGLNKQLDFKVERENENIRVRK